MAHPGSAYSRTAVPNGASCCSRPLGIWQWISMESSNTIGARAQREFEDLLKHDRAVVVALVFVIAISWLYLPAGAGMGMSAFENVLAIHGYRGVRWIVDGSAHDCHEPVLDRWIGAVRAAGENHSARVPAGVALRARPRRVGRGPLGGRHLGGALHNPSARPCRPASVHPARHPLRAAGRYRSPEPCERSPCKRGLHDRLDYPLAGARSHTICHVQLGFGG